MQDIPAGMAKVAIFDFRNRKAFPYLSALKNHGLYQIALNQAQATALFNQLEETIQHRHHNLFTTETHLDEYNQHSRRKEPYYLVILNLDDFPESQLSSRRVQAFLDSAYSAGIYVIAFQHGENSNNGYQHQGTQQFLHQLPAIRFNDGQWQMPETTFPLATFFAEDFRLETVSLNQHTVLKQLQQTLESQQQKDESQDFLQVKIGELPNGEPAYFRLGAKSGNYSGLLIGATGTGKSTLMNNLVVQIGEHYTAKQIQLYLMDYKQGNEFKSFQHHPNVKYLFTNRNAQSGVQLLEQLVQEHHQRNALWAEDLEVKDIDSYNRKYPDKAIPHILLIIDEFQAMFSNDYNQQERLNSLLKTVTQQGRSSGLHILLSTQSMNGVPLSQSAKQQLKLRIAYWVDEVALFDVVDSAYKNQVKALQKYQALFQLSPMEAHTVFVDKPHNIQQSIEQLWQKRPVSLCVKTEVVEAQPEPDGVKISENLTACETPFGLSASSTPDWLQDTKQQQKDDEQLLARIKPQLNALNKKEK